MKTPKHKFRIYVNLNKKNIFSVQSKVNGNWKVITYMESFIAKNAFLKVYESGRRRVLKDKKRNVHAYLMANEIQPIEKPNIQGLYQVRYNPYRQKQFKIGYPFVLQKSKELAFSNCFYANEIIGTNCEIYLLKSKIILPEEIYSSKGNLKKTL